METPAPAPFATAATQPQAIPGGLKRSISAAAAAAAAPRSSPVSAAGFPTSDASSPLSTEQQEEEERKLPPEAASGSAGGSHTPPCKPLSLFVQLTEARDEATRAQERERKLEDALQRVRAPALAPASCARTRLHRMGRARVMAWPGRALPGLPV